ncbi:MAG TPA: Uma2 family endonuclease [Candidatus Lokiarchaeia archaeon]|nr:Uma2 family endonuclease [Candidatus Lokiarchaeia archaeon]
MVITLKIDPKNMIKNPENNKISFRYSDIQSIPEWPEGPLIELIKGDLYMVPSPNVNHQRISRRLEWLILEFLRNNPLGEIFHAPVDVVLSEKDVVVPDVFCILENNRNKIQSENIQGAPDFIIEILSLDRKKDLILKKKLYEHYGVKEYWIIDSEENQVESYVLNEDNGFFENKKIYRAEDTIASIILHGFAIMVQQLFQDETKE